MNGQARTSTDKHGQARTSTDKHGQARLIDFEIMRGVAALQVLMVHYEYYFINAKHYFSGAGVISPFFPGAVGMVLFFVLSGFLISYSYFEKLRTGDHRSIVKYVLKRYFRLWPLQVITLSSIFLFSVPHYPGNGWSLLAHATLSHALFPLNGNFFMYNELSWSIGVEMVCYFAFILFCVMTRPLNTIVLAILGVAGIYVAYQSFTLWTLPLAVCSNYVGCGFHVLKWGAAFVLGLSLFLLLRVIDLAIGIRLRLRYAMKLASLVSLLLFLTYGYLKHAWYQGAVVPMSGGEWLILSAFWIATAFLGRNIHFTQIRLTPLYWAGIASYSIYLWHQIIALIVDRWISSAIALPISIVLVFVLAAVSYRFIEQPPRRWIARRLANQQQ